MDLSLWELAFDREWNKLASLSTESFDESGIETNLTYRQSRNRDNRHHKRVTFNLENNEVYQLPEEDRMSIWMVMGDNRRIFQRRIRNMESILDPILKKHVCVSVMCGS